MVKHSQDKDQFLKVAVKWMQETQTFEAELKAVIELNSILLSWNKELETKLTEESQSKEGNLPSSFYFTNHIRIFSRLIVTLSYRIQGPAHGPQHHSW
jgi:hypothetical protein